MLTDHEVLMLQTIAAHDGLGRRVPFVNPFDAPNTASGVCSSLSRKRLAYFNPRVGGSTGQPPTMVMTEKGFDALRDVDPSCSERLRVNYRRSEEEESRRLAVLQLGYCRKRLVEARAIAFREAMRRKAGESFLTDEKLEEIASLARFDLAQIESLQGGVPTEADSLLDSR